jgi:TolB protein
MLAAGNVPPKREGGGHVDARRMTQLATVVLAGALLTACSSDLAAAPVGSGGPLASGGQLPGTLVYAPPESNGKITLQTWTAGATDAKPAAVLDSGDVLASTTLSPDGKRIAYVHADSSGAQLTVAALDGSGAKVLLAGVEPYCDEPNWSGDGSRVAAMANPTNHQAGSVPVAGGAFTAFPTAVVGCHVVWSGDGASIAYATASGITVSKVDGSGGHPVPKLGPDGGTTKRRSSDAMSLSADGRLIALFVQQGDDPGDSADGTTTRGLVANEIVDTTTGDTVTLPVTGELQQAYFLPKGGVLVRTNDKDTMRLTLLSADLKVVAGTVEPPSLTAALLLGYSS